MENKLAYQKATVANIDELVTSRIKVLRTVFGICETEDVKEIKEASAKYYKKAIEDGTHVAYLVYDKDVLVAVGGICYYQVMPMPYNPSGEKAYIMNMYTDEKYRGRGVAGKVVDLLVEDAKQKGIWKIALSATEMGKPVYEKHGFIMDNDTMIYGKP